MEVLSIQEMIWGFERELDVQNRIIMELKSDRGA
jgi:hypothetical protein